MEEGERTVLSPGQSVRPQMGQEEARKLVSRLYGLTASDVQELNSYDDRNFRVWINESTNPYIDDLSPDGYVLKVLNSLDSKCDNALDAQNQLILYVHSRGIPTTRPLKNLKGDLQSLEHLSSTSVESDTKYLVRLFEFMTGRILYGVPYTAELVFDIGKLAASLDHICQSFHHAAFENHKRIWSLTEVPKLVEFLHCVDESRRGLIQSVIDSYNTEVVGRYQVLQKGIIHGDFNEQNILVRPKQGDGDHFELTGILDFGDSTLSFCIFEVAIVMCYMMLGSTVMDSLECGGHTLAGYLSAFDLKPIDLHVLKECISARLAQSLVMGAYSSVQDPDNAEYILISAPKSWKLLERVWNKPKQEIYQFWRDTVKHHGIDVVNLISTYDEHV